LERVVSLTPASELTAVLESEAALQGAAR
jgi:hypothetical protein